MDYTDGSVDVTLASRIGPCSSRRGADLSRGIDSHDILGMVPRTARHKAQRHQRDMPVDFRALLPLERIGLNEPHRPLRKIDVGSLADSHLSKLQSSWQDMEKGPRGRQ